MDVERDPNPKVTQPIEELGRILSALNGVGVEGALKGLSEARFDRGRIHTRPGDLECPAVPGAPDALLRAILSHRLVTPRIVAALGGWGGPTMIDMLRERLREWTDSGLRVAAILALETIGGPEAARTLIGLAQGSSSRETEAALGALRSLASMHDPNALEGPIALSPLARAAWDNHRAVLEKTQSGALILASEGLQGDMAAITREEMLSALEAPLLAALKCSSLQTDAETLIEDAIALSPKADWARRLQAIEERCSATRTRDETPRLSIGPMSVGDLSAVTREVERPLEEGLLTPEHGEVLVDRAPDGDRLVATIFRHATTLATVPSPAESARADPPARGTGRWIAQNRRPQWVNDDGTITLAAASSNPEDFTFDLTGHGFEGKVEGTVRVERDGDHGLLRVRWEASFTHPAGWEIDFHHATQHTLLKRVRLGPDRVGNELFMPHELGFDPVEVPWVFVVHPAEEN